MNELDTSTSENPVVRLKRFVEETDIRILVFAPPVIGFVAIVFLLFIAGLLAGGRPSQAFIDIALGVVFLAPVLSGLAEIHKKEMPGPFGKIIKGKVAIASGIVLSG